MTVDTMDNNTVSSQLNHKSKLETSVARLKFCLRAFAFVFLTCCTVAPLSGAATSSEQAYLTDLSVLNPPETSHDTNGPNVPGTLSTAFGRQLWRARIGFPDGQRNQKGKDELEKIIKQVRAVKLEPEKKTPQPALILEPTSATEPNEKLPLAEASKKAAEEVTELRLPYEPLADQTLQTLRNLSKHPDKLRNPFELAEVLFLCGNTKEAAGFYQEALNRKDADDVWSARDRVWILFQIGNCLRNEDPPAAQKMYGQLIVEYPDSPWTDLAKAQEELIDWYRQDEPWTLTDGRVLGGSQTVSSKTESDKRL